MMKNAIALGFLAALLVGAAPQDKKRGPKNKEVQKAFAALMEEIGKENKAIKKDMEEKKWDAAIRPRLEKIKKNAEAASKLDYLQGEEEDLERFKAAFEIFIDIRLKQFLEATWDEAGSEKLYERLQSACRTCHEQFRDE